MSEAPGEGQSEKTADEIWSYHYDKFWSALSGLVSAQNPVHLEIFGALAQVMADLSGYRVVLQAPLNTHLPLETGTITFEEHYNILIAEPED